MSKETKSGKLTTTNKRKIRERKIRETQGVRVLHELSLDQESIEKLDMIWQAITGNDANTLAKNHDIALAITYCINQAYFSDVASKKERRADIGVEAASKDALELYRHHANLKHLFRKEQKKQTSAAKIVSGIVSGYQDNDVPMPSNLKQAFGTTKGYARWNQKLVEKLLDEGAVRDALQKLSNKKRDDDDNKAN